MHIAVCSSQEEMTKEASLLDYAVCTASTLQECTLQAHPIFRLGLCAGAVKLLIVTKRNNPV